MVEEIGGAELVMILDVEEIAEELVEVGALAEVEVEIGAVVELIEVLEVDSVEVVALVDDPSVELD